MIKYVFFDLDGTLIDIKHAQNTAIQSLFYTYKFDAETDIESFIKVWNDLTEYHYKFYTTKKISYKEQRKRRIVDLFETFEVELTQLPLNVYDIYLKEFEKNWICYDDVSACLKNLKNLGYKLGIISNGDYSQQVQKLKNTKIYSYFDYINTSSQFEFSKPNPKLFERILSAYRIPLNEVCYVGDSYENDYKPCQKLGMNAVLLNRSNDKLNNSVTQISTLDDLINLLNK